MTQRKHYFLNKLKHQAFPHLSFETDPAMEQQAEHFFAELAAEMIRPEYQSAFQQRYPFEFLSEAEMLELEDDEYRRYLRFFTSERVEALMYLDDQLYGRNTLDHLLGVHYIALATARKLKAHGIPVDLGRVSASASGHDIGKYGVLPPDLSRMAYYHYFYSDQWYRKRRLENLGNVAVNHSTWDLELNSLSVESLILIYSDFRVKNNAAGEMELFSLKDSYEVILNKLDNLDEAKTLRYRRVYAKLTDFENYLSRLDQVTPPVALADFSDLLAEYKSEGIDESIYTMHELRSPASIRQLLENSFDQPTVTLSLVVLRLLKDYHLYLTVSQKDIILDHLYRLVLHADELIRQQSAELIGLVLRHYDIVYRKERPSSAPPNPVQRQKMRRIEQMERFYRHRYRALTKEKRHWLDESYQLAMANLYDDTPEPAEPAVCPEDDMSLDQRYLANLKTAVPEEVKLCNIDYLRRHDQSFHFVMHLINLIKVSSSRQVQRYAGQTLLELFDRFGPAQKNDITIELLRSMDLAGHHLRLELPLIVGQILHKLPDNEVLEILDDVHQSIEESKPSAPSLLEAIIHTLPDYLDQADQTIADKICALFGSALVNRDHSIDQVAILRLASFYQSETISLAAKRNLYLKTAKKYLTLSREMENDFQTRLNYSNYISGVYNFISQYENQAVWPEPAEPRRLLVSANFDPINLAQKALIQQYIADGYEVFIHLSETNWHYLLAPQQLRRVMVEMTMADQMAAFLWPGHLAVPPAGEMRREILAEDDQLNEQVRQAVQYEWQTSELLSPQVERFIRSGFLYRNLAQRKKQAARREEYLIYEEGSKLWLRSDTGRIESIEYDPSGRIYQPHLMSQRGLYDNGLILLNQAIYRLYDQGIDQVRLAVSEKISPRLLQAMGFIRQGEDFILSLKDPVLFIMDLPSRIVDVYRREKRLRTRIAKNRRRIMTGLRQLYPGRAILAFDRGMFYNDLIDKVAAQPGDQVVVPIGSMFQHHDLPEHPTKALYIDKLYSAAQGDIEVVAQRNHLPIERQVETLRRLGEKAIIIDDVLHSGRRVNTLAPLLEKYDLPIAKYMVGIATKAGIQHAQANQVPVSQTYLFDSISDWFLESELYLFLGGLVSANRRNDRLYSLSINRIAPFIEQSPADEFGRFSRTCIQAAEDLLKVADKIFRERHGRPMRLSDLNHLVFDVYLPDVFFHQVSDMTIDQFFERFYATL